LILGDDILNFKRENGNLKIIVSIIIVILIVIIGIVILNLTKKKPVETIKQDPYEYFTLSSLDEKVGVIDKTGKEIIKPEYESVYIPNQSKDVFVCFKDESNYSILDSNGKDLYQEYNSVYPIVISDASLEMEKNVLSYEENGKYGLIDFSGKKLTDAIYDEVSSLSNKPGCILARKDGVYGVLDSKGNTIIDVKYNSIKGDEYSSAKDGYLKTGYIVSEKTNSGIIYGYIDYNGKMLISPKYELVTRVLEYDEDNIYLIFMDHGKKGVIKNKKVIIKPKYQAINYYNNSNVFVVNRNEKYGFFDSTGKEILKAEYTSYSIAGNYISVKKDDEMRLFDLHGNLVNTNTYRSIIGTNNPSYFIAQNENGYYSIISKDVQIDDKYTNIAHAFDNFFVFTTEEGKSGILNIYAGIEVEPEYDYIIVLDNINALEARKGNEVDIYSKKIEKVLTMKDAVVQNVNDNYVSIYSNSELNYINKDGELVKNTEVYKDSKLYSYKDENDKWGFKNGNGDIIIECKYDVVTELNQYGFAGIYQDGKWGVIDENGTIIVDPIYEIETYYSPKFVGKYLLEEQESVYCIEVEKKKK